MLTLFFSLSPLLVSCQVPNGPDEEAVRIFIEFERMESAIKGVNLILSHHLRSRRYLLIKILNVESHWLPVEQGIVFKTAVRSFRNGMTCFVLFCSVVLFVA